MNVYLDGNFSPVTEEVTAYDLRVIGEIPFELEGRYLRNGPNPRSIAVPEHHHWFSGDGMVHGVRLRGGKAEWYRNRWVRNQRLALELGEAPTPGDFNGQSLGSPNTNVGGWAGTTWAMVEGGTFPITLDYELNTVASNPFFGTLPGAFSAHPKFDPVTRELHAVCHSWMQWMDHVQYVVVGSDGQVTKTVDIGLPGMVMIHDMSLTQTYAVIYDLPVTVDLDLAFAGRFPFRWNPTYTPRIGLLPRDGGADDIIWCSIDPCYGYHPMNAYDAPDGTVVIDICRYDTMFANDILGPGGDCLPTLYRWTVDPVRRAVHQECLDDRTMEFPRVAGSVSTLPHRYGYTAGVNTGFIAGDLLKRDFATGVTQVHQLGKGRGAAEPDFIAKANPSSEDDGWLMSYVFDEATDSSELLIIDALDLTAAPVARVLLPQRVPYGFHGNWISDHSVAPD
jgi:8'-apo-carotenoid 13,14-cleaving dioxygenase